MNNTAKMKRVRWIGMVGLFVLVSLSLIAAKPGDSQKEHVGGLVYIDANHNGVWDVGEEGYGGEYGVAKEEGDWVWRHRGATITFTPIGSGPGDDDDYPFVVESLPHPREDPNDDSYTSLDHGALCTLQDMPKLKDDESYVPVRPCLGTFGMISWAKHVTWAASIDVPEGYELTSEPVVTFFTTGKDGIPFIDFGIAPVSSG
jgi:hypothetical protein